MEVEGYTFDGPYTDIDEISEHHTGVYMVLCLVSGRPHCVLYIGTSEGGSQADVTPTGNLQATLENHRKRNCWEENTHGEVGYFVKPVSDSKRRTEIRDELQWKYVTPCGVDPWDAPQTSDDWVEFEDKYGSRGSSSI